jgi:beta-glucosidase
VVISAPGPVDFSRWIDHANVSAVLFTYFPTTEGGPAVASVLFGDVNPSGKLPFTVAANVADYDSGAYYNGTFDLGPSTVFTEGTFVDYRYFDEKNISPLYEFGFGLSYTSCVLLPFLHSPSTFLFSVSRFPLLPCPSLSAPSFASSY